MLGSGETQSLSAWAGAGLMEQIAIQIQTTQHALLLQWWRYSCVNASINMWSCEDNVNHKWAVWLASKTFGEGRVLSTFRWQLYCLAMTVFCVQYRWRGCVPRCSCRRCRAGTEHSNQGRARVVICSQHHNFITRQSETSLQSILLRWTCKTTRQMW